MTGRRILLVEDNNTNRRVATELLGDLGILVTLAPDGREAISRIERERFDLVQIDIQMPVMDGLTATKLLRADERFRSLPIIAMTAHAMSGDRERSLEAGMNDHVTKPLNPQLLTDTLVRWMPAAPAIDDGLVGERAEFAPSQDGIPYQLLPFDIPAALARMNGKRGLLREILLDFRDEYKNAVPDLLEHIRERREDEAERLAHSLKSVAATLEARDLAEAAFGVEQAFRERRIEGMTRLIDKLRKRLEPAIAAVSSLELERMSVMPPSLPDATAKDMPFPNSRPCVLIVDDERSTRALLRDTFSSGYEVLFASDGLTALEIAAVRMPQVILLDVIMAGIDGYEVCRRLKTTPQTSDIPVIFVTGKGDREAETGA